MEALRDHGQTPRRESGLFIGLFSASLTYDNDEFDGFFIGGGVASGG